MTDWLKNIVLVFWITGFVGALIAMIAHWMKVGPVTLLRYKNDFAASRMERLFQGRNTPDPDQPEHYGYGGELLACSLVLVAVCSVILIIFGAE